MAGELPSDLRLKRLRRRGWAVLLALALLLTTVVAWNIIQGIVPRARLVARPEQSVQGLSVGSPVRLRGVEVGQVVALRLWQPSVGGELRPEAVLSVDLRLAPQLAEVETCVREGLRVEFSPANPASGFLGVDLVWRPGTPAPRHDAFEIPCAPRGGILAGLPGMATRLRVWSERDLVAEVATFTQQLEVLQSRLDQPQLLSETLAEASALNAKAQALERLLGPEAVPIYAGRLGEIRETLRQLSERLGRGEAAITEVAPELASDLAALSQRLRQWTEDARERTPSGDR